MHISLNGIFIQPGPLKLKIGKAQKNALIYTANHKRKEMLLRSFVCSPMSCHYNLRIIYHIVPFYALPDFPFYQEQ